MTAPPSDESGLTGGHVAERPPRLREPVGEGLGRDTPFRPQRRRTGLARHPLRVHGEIRDELLQERPSVEGLLQAAQFDVAEDENVEALGGVLACVFVLGASSEHGRDGGPRAPRGSLAGGAGTVGEPPARSQPLHPAMGRDDRREARPSRHLETDRVSVRRHPPGAVGTRLRVAAHGSDEGSLFDERHQPPQAAAMGPFHRHRGDDKATCPSMAQPIPSGDEGDGILETREVVNPLEAVHLLAEADEVELLEVGPSAGGKLHDEIGKGVPDGDGRSIESEGPCRDDVEEAASRVVAPEGDEACSGGAELVGRNAGDEHALSADATSRTRGSWPKRRRRLGVLREGGRGIWFEQPDEGHLGQGRPSGSQAEEQAAPLRLLEMAARHCRTGAASDVRRARGSNQRRLTTAVTVSAGLLVRSRRDPDDVGVRRHRSRRLSGVRPRPAPCGAVRPRIAACSLPTFRHVTTVLRWGSAPRSGRLRGLDATGTVVDTTSAETAAILADRRVVGTTRTAPPRTDCGPSHSSVVPISRLPPRRSPRR